MPEQVADALEALYREFSRHRPKGPIEYSPLKSYEYVAPLESKPLRDLTADDFRGYAGAAVWTIGSPTDFKYFFPRMAELALFEVVGNGSWHSWAYRLGPALGSPSERSVTEAFFSALWATLTESFWDVVKVDAVDLLYALPFIFDDIEPLLAQFSPCPSRAAALHLKDLCELGPTHACLGEQPPRQVSDWLAQRAPTLLASAIAIYPDIED